MDHLNENQKNAFLAGLLALIVIVVLFWFVNQDIKPKSYSSSFGAYKDFVVEYAADEHEPLRQWWKEYVYNDFKNDPEQLYILQWRELEEFACFLFQYKGSNATLTKRTRDGGKDIIIEHISPSGEKIICLVECKQYKKGRKVGEDKMRLLHSVFTTEKVNQCILFAPSGFTKGAQNYVDNYGGNQIILYDVEKIKEKLLS